MRATWKPHEKHGQLTKRSDLPDSVYAFPKKRKEPMTDARHVRNAAARFDQVEGVTKAERDLAFANIKKAAKQYGVDLSESSAADFGVKPQSKANKTKRVAARKKTTAKKTTAKKTSAKKSSAKKASAKKSAAKKSAVKKPAARKRAAKKTSRKKAARGR